MRVDRSNAVCVDFGSPVMCVIQLVTSRAALFASFVFFATVFVIYFVAIYVPILSAYKGGCVLGATNGTFITRNIFAVSYNYASSDGSENLFDGLSDYNNRKASYCSRYSTTTRQRQNRDQILLESLRSSQRSARDSVYQTGKCLAQSAMDALFEQACCGDAGYDACSAYGTDDGWLNSTLRCPVDSTTGAPFLPPGTTLSAHGCHAPESWADWTLENAVFTCGTLPDCSATCAGPSRELLTTVADQCGCTAEWMGHATFLKFAIGIVIYVLLNIGRVQITEALCKVFWRYLTPGIFTYRATCDHHGNVLAPRDTETFDSFTGPEGSIKTGLDETLKRFVTFAGLQIAIAALLQAVWIFFLVTATQNLAYDPMS
jgi:hypothetical protein